MIGSRWNNIDEVDRDRSYLMSWVWQETGPGAAGGELHVNLRGYPGRTRVPKCVNADSKRRELIPCFSDPGGRVRAPGIMATVYTVNQDADQWHVLYAWRTHGSLYTVSEHVAPPFELPQVRAEPRSHDAQPRAGPATPSSVRLTRRQAARRRCRRRAAARPASTSSSTG